MLYKNMEIHNVAELYENEDGSVSWLRMPASVAETFEKSAATPMVRGSTGVELRFVLRGDSVRIRMSTAQDDPNGFATFHVYRGGMQGGWVDHEVHCHVTGKPEDFVIRRSENEENLKKMSEACGLDWDPCVIRVIFDRGAYKLYGVEGDIEPPRPDQCPKRTLLAYGSSITHGSNAIDASHSWVSVLAHNLNMDARNLGMAGSCALEPAVADYLASEGEAGRWHVAVLELGINVPDWEEEMIAERVENLIRQIAGRNPDKPIWAISPFYYAAEDLRACPKGKKWRRVMADTLARLNYPNVTYVDGTEILGHYRYLSADEIHPNIYGCEHIAQELTARMQQVIGGEGQV